jgi:hypothetical protein
MPHPPHDRLRALLEEIANRAPRPEAARRVRVGTPHARSVYLSYVRLAGPREDVLDYAASLLEADARRAGAAGHAGGTTLELVAIEAETDEELTLLFSKPLYEGE